MGRTIEQKTGVYLSMRTKLLLGFTLVFTLVFLGIYVWFYNFATSVARQRLVDSLQNALFAASQGINGDAFEALYNEVEPTVPFDRGDADPENDLVITDDPRYWQIVQWLADIHVVDPNANIWTFVRGEGESDYFYVADGLILSDPSSEYATGFKEADEADTGQLFTGLEDFTIFLDAPYEWQGADWVSGYGPIRNSQGEVVGGVGADYRFDYVKDVERSVLQQALPAFAISYGVLFLMVFFAASVFTDPIKRVTRVAERIGEGDYNQSLDGLTQSAFPDEITTLARVFDSMTVKVEEREIKLKERVAQLEIVLDSGKRDEQVAEIVDSDFFQSLQSKAREMRQRKSQSSSTT